MTLNKTSFSLAMLNETALLKIVKQEFSKYDSEITWEFLRLLGALQSYNYFLNNTKALFFFIAHFSQEYTVEFSNPTQVISLLKDTLKKKR